MSKSITLASMLLLSSALCTPAFAAAAQTGTGSAGQSTPPRPGAEESIDDAAEPGTQTLPEETQVEEEVEISAPGASDTSEGEDIVVVGRNIPNPIRATPQVISVLSSADIARTGEGDIAGALQRVTGLSVVGEGFVFVRGLGDRYSLALLNGLALPSPEPLRRVVPLNIFPTNVVTSAVVQKSYSVNYPGEFGGGVINLTTNALPTDTFVTVGGSIGADTFSTSNLGYTYFGSDLDRTGFDDGTRDPSPVFQRALDAGTPILPGGTFTNAALAEITRSLVNAETTLVQRNDHIPFNGSAELTAGTSFDVGATRVGLIATGGYTNSWRTRDARQQLGPSDQVTEDFRSIRTENRVGVNALVGLGFEFDDHKLRFTNLYIRDTSKLASIEGGFSINITDPIPGVPDQLLRQNTNWIERSLFNTQFVGEFEFGDFSLDTRFAYANSKRESPYERDFQYVYSTYTPFPFVNDYLNLLDGRTSSAAVAFSDLNEDVYNGGIDIGYRFNTDIPISLSAGYAYLNTERYSERREFFFRPLGDDIPFTVAQLRPDFLLSDFNVNTFGITLQETNALGGLAAYEASLEVHAGYVQADVDIQDDVSFQIGVRYEEADQAVAPLDILNVGSGLPTTGLRNDYFLPAATLTSNFADNMQLRVHASKTIARPQFRELANQLYIDVDSDRQFTGNRFLIDSELFNAEIRYEWYFARGQRFTLAGFFKKIDNPIETVSTTFGGGIPGRITTFANAPSANLYGGEVELVRYYALDTLFDGNPFLATRRALISANYTYSKSELKVGGGDTVLIDTGGIAPQVENSRNRFFDGAALTGQSDHLFNLQVGLEDTERLSQQTILVTYASDRVTRRGAFTGGVQFPDTIERPGARLDFVWREGVSFGGREIEAKFEARNITGRDFIEQQPGVITLDTLVYEVGTSFSFGLSVKL